MNLYHVHAYAGDRLAADVVSMGVCAANATEAASVAYNRLVGDGYPMVSIVRTRNTGAPEHGTWEPGATLVYKCHTSQFRPFA